jgi:hypothetical protein
VLAEPIGTRHQDHIALFDLRAEKIFKLNRGLSVSGFLDAFNLFNANAEQNTSYNSGSSFLRPLNIIPPRIVRIGAGSRSRGGIHESVERSDVRPTVCVCCAYVGPASAGPPPTKRRAGPPASLAEPNSTATSVTSASKSTACARTSRA